MAFHLKNCTIVDGSGQPPFPGDIMLSGERIAAVGSALPERADAQIIDCTGLTVTPGFIDCHSHNDWFALSEDHARYFDPFVLQGITTFVAGNCGFSVSGYAGDSAFKSRIGGGLFKLDAASRDLHRFGTWFDQVDKACPVNMACLAGHGSARIGVNGEKNAPLTAQSRAAMLCDLELALEEGACGISLGLMYEPGIYAPYDELVEVARLCAKYDRILAVHPRAESNVSMSYSNMTRSHLLLALDELDRLVRQTGVRLQHSHLIFAGRQTWKVEKQAVAILRKLKDDGFDVAFDMYPLDYGASIITVVLPDWYQAMAHQDRHRLGTRLRLALMVRISTLLVGFNFSDIRIAYGGEDQKDIIGKTIAEIAREHGTSPLRTYLDVCEASDFKASVLMGAYQNDEIVRNLMNNDLSLFMTDAWVEPQGKQNGSIYGAMPLFVEKAAGMGWPVERAIAKMTGLSASRFKLAERGLIREGYFADLNVMDLQNLKNRIATEQPPLGLQYTFINGTLAAHNGHRVASDHLTGRAVRVA